MTAGAALRATILYPDPVSRTTVAGVSGARRLGRGRRSQRGRPGLSGQRVPGGGYEVSSDSFGLERLSRMPFQGIISPESAFGVHRLVQINSLRPLRSLAKAFGRGGREASLAGLAAAAVFLVIAISSYHRGDPSWSVRNGAEHVVNRGGVVGAWISDLLLLAFGHVAWIVPALLVVVGIGLFVVRERTTTRLVGMTRFLGFALIVMAACGLATLHYGGAGTLPDGIDAGGALGTMVGRTLSVAFNFVGATVIMLAMLFVGWTLFTRVSWLTVMEVTGRLTVSALSSVSGMSVRRRERREVTHARRERVHKVAAKTKRNPRRSRPPRIEPVLTDIEPSPRATRERQTVLFEPTGPKIPELAHLDAPSARPPAMSESALETMSRQVEIKLRDFGIDVEVVAVHPGPVITRFELQPSPGLKVSRVTALAKDLARSLSTVSVRIVEIIPGKPVIGLEVPNEEVELVYLSEILSSSDYDKSASPVTLGLGKDISGQPVVVDLARMPHLLVAGTTGSGKSVALNAMILSILYKATPDQARLIMVDPKMLELSVYEGIPHLLAPVVTDMKDAANAFRWCIGEMERRYRLMSELGVRNLSGYNRKVADAVKDGEPLRDPLAGTEIGAGEGDGLLTEGLPLIVVVVDELADLMMVAGKKIEQLIARLAQKARASGIHLLLATQRPSVDVITGLIKANIPSRIAFQVSSRVDSRTILDQGGAEQLLGHGDMLHLTPGMQAPARVHGAFVSDQEVHRVVDHLKSDSDPEYVDGVLEGGEWSSGAAGGEGATGDEESDPLYDEAVRMVTESGRASISGVQRRLKIGYNRAARMVEQMEVAGVVGPVQSNGSREVLASPPPPPD